MVASSGGTDPHESLAAESYLLYMSHDFRVSTMIRIETFLLILLMVPTPPWAVYTPFNTSNNCLPFVMPPVA